MRLLDSLRFRLCTLFQRSHLHDDMEQELLSHIALRADDLERSGLARAEAERRARLEFGSQGHFREECAEAAGGNFVESVVKDLRFALRVLRKSPGFTFVAVGTLALAIGANAVVFAALNAMVLRPLNVPRPESLYSLHRVQTNSANQSVPGYRDLRDRVRSLEGLAAYNIVQAAMDIGNEPSRAWGIAASGNYFDVLGIQPHLGRLFHESDENGPNSAPFIVLSHATWRRQFQSDPSVVGRVVLLNKHPFTVIGVAPAGFTGTLLFMAPDFFMPLVNQEQIEGVSVLDERATPWLFMTLGHLKAGVTPKQAEAEINAIWAELVKEHPSDHAPASYALARPSLYGEFMGRPVRAFLTALMLLAGLILLAACANLGSLFAARAADRSREVALRMALGAGRTRILRQLLTEALLISLAGGALGLWGSTILLGWLRAWQPFPQFPFNLLIAPDAKVYGVAVLLALLSGFLFGAVPVRQVLRTDPYQVVKSGSRVTRQRHLTGRDLLVAAQIAICAVLVTSSLVAVRGLMRSLNSDFGFDPQNAILVETHLGMAGYDGEAIPAMQKRMVEELESVPGVTAVGLVVWPPLSNGTVQSSYVFKNDTADLRPANAAATTAMYPISPDYLRAADTTLLAGRSFTWHDDAAAPRVAVINQEFARRIFGSTSHVLGRTFKVRDGSVVEVVGVVEDGKYQSIAEDPRPAMFLPLLQSPVNETWAVVRTAGDPKETAAALRVKLRELDAGLPVFIESWTQVMHFPLFPSRVAAVSLGILGFMGAMLSITGIFGLAAYAVSRRLRELGIRIALGAQRKEVLQAALGRAVKLLAVGSVAGLFLGIFAAKVLAFIVYQATPRDPVVLAGVVFAMALLGLLATWIPAQRALSIDPAILLRDE